MTLCLRVRGYVIMTSFLISNHLQNVLSCKNYSYKGHYFCFTENNDIYSYYINNIH